MGVLHDGLSVCRSISDCMKKLIVWVPGPSSYNHIVCARHVTACIGSYILMLLVLSVYYCDHLAVVIDVHATLLADSCHELADTSSIVSR